MVKLLIEPDAYPVFLTGAGISVASGVPTFRGTDPGAVWAEDVLELGTYRMFQKDPVQQWSWYLERFEAARQAEPNAAHDALVDIEHHFGSHFALITQNVDGLHAAAGSQHLIEIHGAARKMRCSRRGCELGAPKGYLPWDEELFSDFKGNQTLENLPRCPKCHKLLRPHVLWFDEFYTDHEDYQFNAAYDIGLCQMTCLIAVGTSFSVGITGMALEAAHLRNIPVFCVDPVKPVDPKVNWIPERAEIFLPGLAETLLGWTDPSRN